MANDQHRYITDDAEHFVSNFTKAIDGNNFGLMLSAFSVFYNPVDVIPSVICDKYKTWINEAPSEQNKSVIEHWAIMITSSPPPKHSYTTWKSVIMFFAETLMPTYYGYD